MNLQCVPWALTTTGLNTTVTNTVNSGLSVNMVYVFLQVFLCFVALFLTSLCVLFMKCNHTSDHFTVLYTLQACFILYQGIRVLWNQLANTQTLQQLVLISIPNMCVLANQTHLSSHILSDCRLQGCYLAFTPTHFSEVNKIVVMEGQERLLFTRKHEYKPPKLYIGLKRF